MLITLPLVGNEGFYDVSSIQIQIERRTQQRRGYSLSFRLIVRLEYAVSPDGSAARHHGSGGFYALADQTVYQDANHPERQVSLFGQFGIGDPRVNRFAYYTGGGLTVSALITGRKQDEIGFAVAGAHNGTQYLEAQRNQGMRVRKSEAALELTYLAQFGLHLAVQPDIQFVINPGTDPRIKTAFAFMLRFELLF